MLLTQQLNDRRVALLSFDILLNYIIKRLIKEYTINNKNINASNLKKA